LAPIAVDPSMLSIKKAGVYRTAQLPLGLRSMNRLAEFAKHRPGDLMRNTDCCGQLQSVQRPIRVCDRFECGSPFLQRRASILHNRTGGDRRLMAAQLALV